MQRLRILRPNKVDNNPLFLVRPLQVVAKVWIVYLYATNYYPTPSMLLHHKRL